MGSLLAELLPFAIGLAITPAAIATGILFLGSDRPIANASAFAVAFALVYSLNAAVVLVLTSGAEGGLIDDEAKAIATTIIGVILLELTLAGFIQSRGRRRSHVAPQTRTPGWMKAVEGAGPRVAFGLGLALAILNPNIPILIGGLAAVAAAEVSDGDRILAAAFLIVASQIGLTGPILWYRAHRASAERGLATIKDWLGRHEEEVNLSVLIVFGTLFTINGISAL